jgi:hypothetical protein
MNASWARRAGRRWVGWLLAASLVLNAFLLGMLAIDAWQKRAARADGPRALHFELRRLAEGLSDDSEAQVAARLQAIRPQVEARVERLRRLRGDVLAEAARPQPDRAAIDSSLAELREAIQMLQQEVQSATYDALLALPAEARADLAAAAPRR